MKAAIGWLIGLVFVVSLSAEPLLEGRLRLESGEPVADAQVRIFDLTDLRQGAIARALTDGTGYFALPLAALTGQALPARFALGPNYPNPFNPSTIIPYQLAASSQVRLEVFNLLGQRITTLVDGERPAGFHTATWHAVDGAGRAVGAGVYIYRMRVGVESQTGRMVLIDGQAGVSAGGSASVMPGASGIGRSDGADAQVYGLIVSGSGLVPYVDSAFRVESGMAPVELVVSSGQYSAGKATDDDCAFCDLFDTFNDQQEEEEEDLIVFASVSDNSLTPGQAFTLRARVQNQGTDEFQDLVLSYYRSSDATISAQDMLLGTDEVGSLAASSTSGNESISLTASSTSGSYYYGACVASVSDEGDTFNYCSTGVRVIVADEEDQVSIPDADLRAAVEAALGKASGAPITVAEMKTLTRLEANDAGISDLTGLEFATNLRYLSLFDDILTDISSLAGLTSLVTLWLGNNNITDISALSGLTNLESLDLQSNSIADISPLSGLTNLTVLNLFGNNITDVSALGSLTNLTVLNLFGNNITDVSALGSLTNLTNLDLGHNAITDISALSGLTNLTQLGLLWNVLNDSSINDHIPVLESRGVTVHFDSFHKGDFDIELVLLGDITEDYTEGQKHALQWVSRRWMSIITEDLPDYEFAQDWSGTCGEHSFEIPSGERVDDLRIYVSRFEDADGPAGHGGVSLLRDTRLPIVGCMTFNTKFLYWLVTGLHETGHVLGFGQIWGHLGFRQDYSQDDPSADTHFNGPLAIAAFNDAGGGDYTGAKVPVQKMDGSHWRDSVLEGEIMGPGGGPALSAITVQSLADLGYGVDVTQADAYTLPSVAAGKASAKITAAMPAIPGVDVTQADAYALLGDDPHWQGRIAGGLPLLPGDDRLRGRLESAEWIGGRGFGRLTGRLAPSPRAMPEMLCGAGLWREPIYVIDPQGRIIRTIGD